MQYDMLKRLMVLFPLTGNNISMVKVNELSMTKIQRPERKHKVMTPPPGPHTCTHTHILLSNMLLFSEDNVKRASFLNQTQLIIRRCQ